MLVNFEILANFTVPYRFKSPWFFFLQFSLHIGIQRTLTEFMYIKIKYLRLSSPVHVGPERELYPLPRNSRMWQIRIPCKHNTNIIHIF